MPRGRGRGGKRPAKKGGLGGKRELLFKESGEEYAQVLKLLGGSKMEVLCMDLKKRLAKVRGKFKRRVWVNVGDIILVALREFEDEKCDIIHVFYADEAKSLKAMGEIPQDIQISEQLKQENNELKVSFGKEGQEEENEPKKKQDKQDLNKYMPSDSSEEDSSEEDVKAKPKPTIQQVAPKQAASVIDKFSKAPVQTTKKPQYPNSKRSDSEDNSNDDDSEEKPDDDLADI